MCAQEKKTSARGPIQPRVTKQEPRRPLLDLPGAEASYGLPERFLRRLIQERRIEFVKDVRRVFLDPDVIDRWIDERRVAAAR